MRHAMHPLFLALGAVALGMLAAPGSQAAPASALAGTLGGGNPAIHEQVTYRYGYYNYPWGAYQYRKSPKYNYYRNYNYNYYRGPSKNYNYYRSPQQRYYGQNFYWRWR